MKKMRRPVVITSPWGTPEETARIYGIPKRRASELRKMVEESLAKKGYIVLGESSSTPTKNGASNAASRNGRLKAKTRGNTTIKSRSGNASRKKTTRAKAKTAR